MTNQRGGVFLALLGLFTIGLIVALVALSIKEEREWAAFSATHKCRVVGHITGDINTGVGVRANGQVTTVTTTSPSKTGYLCDDGVTYWR